MNTNNALKALSIVSLLLALWILISNWEQIVCMTNADCRDQQTIEAWNKAYEMDTYGGTTPEETLSLFVEALKKGDIELASKYFLIDEQEEAKKDLINMKEGDSLVLLKKDIASLIKTTQTNEESRFEIIKNNRTEVLVILQKIQNGIWKISSL